MIQRKKLYGVEKIDIYIMFQAYKDVTGDDITNAVWWSTIDAAIRRTWMEYLKSKIPVSTPK